MFSKANLLATFAGFLVLFILGWIFYGILAADFYESHHLHPEILKDDENMSLGMIVLSSLIQAFVLSFLFQKWAKGSYSIKEGFIFGAWFGVFVGFGIGLMWYAMSQLMDITGTLFDSTSSIFYYGITGMVIGWVYKKTATK
jgi:hypothetical protein